MVAPVFLKDEWSATINWHKLQQQRCTTSWQRRESDGNGVTVMAAG